MFPLFEARKAVQGFADRFVPRPEEIRLASPPAQPNSAKRANIEMFSPAANVLRYNSRDSRRGENSSRENSASSARSKPLAESARLEKQAVRVLAAPGLRDDYYLNLLAWGEMGLIAVALGDELHYHNFIANETVKGFELNSIAGSMDSIDGEGTSAPYIGAISFSDSGRQCAVGDSRGTLSLVDVEAGSAVTQSASHGARVASAHWQGNVVATGGRDSVVRLYDVRSSLLTPITTLSGHEEEVCGLKFSPNASLLASGGNDNLLNLWDIRQLKGLAGLPGHEAAVKALAWHSKNAALLASGAGTADRRIRLFDTARLEESFAVDSEAQVCCIAFDADGGQLVSTHGYSLNQLMLWEHGKGLRKTDCLVAHRVRVLFLGLSPCGNYAATAAGDETLRVWKIRRGEKAEKRTKSLFSAQATLIR